MFMIISKQSIPNQNLIKYYYNSENRERKTS